MYKQTLERIAVIALKETALALNFFFYTNKPLVVPPVLKQAVHIACSLRVAATIVEKRCRPRACWNTRLKTITLEVN